MLRKSLKKTLVGSSLFTLGNDTLSKTTETEVNADLSVLTKETGWDRLKRMYSTDEFGNLTPELVTVLHVGSMSLFVGAVYGGFMQTRYTVHDFIKNNQATAFNDHIQAKKKLQDEVTKNFGRGAWKWSWRLSIFCTTFMGISTTISVYRGKSGILEHAIAGLFTGSLYKWNAGPRAMIVGGGLGSALGFFAGSLTYGLLKLSGISMEDVRYWQHRYEQHRNLQIDTARSEAISKKEGEIYYRHDQEIGETGKTLDNLEKQS